MIDLVWLLLLSPLVVANLVFVTETGLGAWPPRKREGRSDDEGDRQRTVVLVPAHDEAAGIAQTLARLRGAMPPGMRTLVVADNCTDETAAIARAAGVEVLERHDDARRGKGYALAAGRERLATDPPGCVIVLDADTVPQGGALANLAAAALASGRPVQASYVIAPDASSSSTARFSAAAFYIKNAVRELGAARIGAPAILTGSGMAFPWPVFARLPLATGHVAEDLMLGVVASLGGAAPRFARTAEVVGGASSDKGTTVQRRRWESGFVQVAREHVPALLKEAALRGRPGLLWLALHLSTPPLVLLLLLNIVACMALAILALAGLAGAALWILAGLTLLAIGLVPVALALHGRLSLLSGWRDIPRYIAWKLRLSLATLIRRERRWVRTDRD